MSAFACGQAIGPRLGPQLWPCGPSFCQPPYPIASETAGIMLAVRDGFPYRERDDQRVREVPERHRSPLDPAAHTAAHHAIAESRKANREMERSSGLNQRKVSGL